MRLLKISLTSVMMLLFFALTACSPTAEETFATPTATIAQFVEEEAIAQKQTSTVMPATTSATPLVAKVTKTSNAQVAHSKTTTPDASLEEATPKATAQETSPSAEVTTQQASPTSEATLKDASPSPKATAQDASPTVEAIEQQSSPTAEPSVRGREGETGTATDMTATPIVTDAAATETVPVATWHALPTKTPNTAATVAPATVAPATIAPAVTSTVISSANVTATPDIASEASDMAGLLNQIANPNKSEDESPSESEQMQSYVDRELAIAFDVPADWTIDSQPGAAGAVYAADKQTNLRFSVLNEESKTLELAGEEVKQGAYGPYISEVKPVKLGQFESLRLNLAPNEIEGGPSVIWLMITPVGRAISFIPQGDLSLIEPILSTVRGIQ